MKFKNSFSQLILQRDMLVPGKFFFSWCMLVGSSSWALYVTDIAGHDLEEIIPMTSTSTSEVLGLSTSPGEIMLPRISEGMLPTLGSGQYSSRILSLETKDSRKEYGNIPFDQMENFSFKRLFFWKGSARSSKSDVSRSQVHISSCWLQFLAVFLSNLFHICHAMSCIYMHLGSPWVASSIGFLAGGNLSHFGMASKMPEFEENEETQEFTSCTLEETARSQRGKGGHFRPFRYF